MKYLLPLLFSVAVVGCKSSSPEPVTSPGAAVDRATSGGEVADAGRCLPDGPGFEVSEYDTSGDSTPDVRKLFKKVGEGSLARLVLVCREADLNGDRRKDIVRLYNDEGQPVREEADRDFDGRIDEITQFTKGRQRGHRHQDLLRGRRTRPRRARHERPKHGCRLATRPLGVLHRRPDSPRRHRPRRRRQGRPLGSG